jgi:hypothetical protein
MDTLPTAASLARALLSLSRSRQTGVLHVMAELGGCRLTIVSGVARAAGGPAAFEEPVEEALACDDAPDPEAQLEAMYASMDVHGPVGRWLVEAGPVERPVHELALRRQLRDRLLHAFACQSMELRFEPDAAAADCALIEAPIGTADLLLATLRAHAALLPREELFAAVARGELRLNALGSMLTRDATLWPEETAALALLEEGGSLVRILQLTAGSDRTLRLVAGLSMLSALSATPGRDQRLSLLVRKSERLRQAASARALCQLPEPADVDDAEPPPQRPARVLVPDALGSE